MPLETNQQINKPQPAKTILLKVHVGTRHERTLPLLGLIFEVWGLGIRGWKHTLPHSFLGGSSGRRAKSVCDFNLK